MSTTVLSAEVVLAEPTTNERERLALAGFLAGYRGRTRDAYALDLRQFIVWCTGHGTRLFAARRADIQCFGRDLEAKGRARSTVSRRLCTVAGFYRYAVEEELWTTHRRCTSAVPGSTTSRTPPPLTATKSGPCWWPPALAPPLSTPSSRYWH